jgi:hypothetical protein
MSALFARQTCDVNTPQCAVRICSAPVDMVHSGCAAKFDTKCRSMRV